MTTTGTTNRYIDPRRARGFLLWLALAFVVFGQPPGASAEEIDAATLARRVDAANRFASLRNVSYGDARNPVVVTDLAPDGHLVVNTFQRWYNNAVDEAGVAARDMVMFRTGKLRGTGILLTDYGASGRPRDYLMWLPSLRKVRRMVEPDAAEHWGSSRLSYGDIYMRRPDDEEHSLLGRETFAGCLGAHAPRLSREHRYLAGLPEADCSIDGRPVVRLHSRPKRGDLDYDERVTLVDSEYHVDYRSIYLRDGRIVKVIDKSWRRANDASPPLMVWRYWYVDAADGHQTMAFVPADAVSWNDDFPADFWSEKTLRRQSR